MNRSVVRKLTLKAGQSIDAATGEHNKFSVEGLPSHLTAEVGLAFGGKYKYRVKQVDAREEFEPRNSFDKPVLALEALQRLLNWDPIIQKKSKSAI
jgi:hypothetical protein